MFRSRKTKPAIVYKDSFFPPKIKTRVSKILGTKYSFAVPPVLNVKTFLLMHTHDMLARITGASPVGYYSRFPLSTALISPFTDTHVLPCTKRQLSATLPCRLLLLITGFVYKRIISHVFLFVKRFLIILRSHSLKKHFYKLKFVGERCGAPPHTPQAFEKA